MITYLHILPIDLVNDSLKISLEGILDGYIEDESCWFEQRDVGKSFLEGDFFYKSFTSIWVFDEQLKKPIKTKTEILNSIKFAIDLEMGFLEYYGSKRDFGKFASNLIKKIDFVKSIHSPIVSLKKLYKNLVDSGIKLIKTTINDYELHDQMIGSYQARIYSDANIDNIFEEFNDRILQIEFQLNEFEELQSILANSQGYYKVNSTENIISEVIKKLKTAQIKSYA